MKPDGMPVNPPYKNLEALEKLLENDLKALRRFMKKATTLKELEI